MSILFSADGLPMFNSDGKVAFGDVPDDCPEDICDITTSDDIDVTFSGIKNCGCASGTDPSLFCCWVGLSGSSSCTAEFNGKTFRCTHSSGQIWRYLAQDSIGCTNYWRWIEVIRACSGGSHSVTIRASVTWGPPSVTGCICFLGTSVTTSFPQITYNVGAVSCCGLIGNGIVTGYDGQSSTVKV